MRRSRLFARPRVGVMAGAVAGMVLAAAGATGASAGPIAAPTSSPAPISSPAPTSSPAWISRPGGLRPNQAASATGDCQLAGVTCKPYSPTSCTGYSSQATPPATIRVLVRTSPTVAQVQTIPFQTYVENVLPNEWPASWDHDALGAGAVAVKSYAWYWVTNFGGYLGTKADCFDVTDDTAFQVYRANSANPRTTAAVLATWPVALREGGRIVQASYRAYLSSSSEACGQFADGSTLSQYGSQTCNEASTGNKYNVILGKYYYPGLQLATAQQLRTAHDFQFLQRSTRVVFAAGHWIIDDGYPTTFSFGLAGDRPVITTDGDGFAHIGVFHPSNATWYIGDPTGRIESRIHFGATGDVPVPAQYAGVQKPTVLAVYRPSNGIWYEATAGGRIAFEQHYGATGDIPVPGHYEGSAATGYADGVALFRPSNGSWYVPGQYPVHFGTKGDIPMPADYDGNGATDLAVYRPSTHIFYLFGHPGYHYGVAGDIPVTGDFTGDGKADLAIYRPATHQWYVHDSTTEVFGFAGGVPIGAAPYSD